MSVNEKKFKAQYEKWKNNPITKEVCSRLQKCLHEDISVIPNTVTPESSSLRLGLISGYQRALVDLVSLESPLDEEALAKLESKYNQN